VRSRALKAWDLFSLALILASAVGLLLAVIVALPALLLGGLAYSLWKLVEWLERQVVRA
jgi:hypothetical protein